jgi:hypothetical protein
MDAHELAKRLTAADSYLASAAQALLSFGSPAMEWSTPLQKATEMLEDIRTAQPWTADLADSEPLLRVISLRVTDLQTLLDSAASIHFGRVLSGCSFNSGYLANGATETVGGGCLWVQG